MEDLSVISRRSYVIRFVLSKDREEGSVFAPKKIASNDITKTQSSTYY